MLSPLLLRLLSLHIRMEFQLLIIWSLKNLSKRKFDFLRVPRDMKVVEGFTSVVAGLLN